jgi:hypothetical protein
LSTPGCPAARQPGPARAAAELRWPAELLRWAALDAVRAPAGGAEEGSADFDALVAEMTARAGGSRLERRAAAAGLGEPVLRPRSGDRPSKRSSSGPSRAAIATCADRPREPAQAADATARSRMGRVMRSRVG